MSPFAHPAQPSAHAALPTGVQVLERGWLSSNNIVCSGEVTAVVDTGYVRHAQQTAALLEHALQGQPLEWIFNTHLHSDHCGGNALLQALYPRVQTRVVQTVAQDVIDWDVDRLPHLSTGQACERFACTATAAPGDVVRLGDLDWQVIASPGHDPDSVMLFEPDTRTLISADALWENGFGVIFPELVGEVGFTDQSDVLDRIESLHAKTVIPGHGAVFTDVNKALDTARSRLAYFQARPELHAAVSLRVFLKFLLLERQRMPWPESIGELVGLGLIERTRQRWMPGMDAALGVQAAADALVKAGAAQWERGALVNV